MPEIFGSTGPDAAAGGGGAGVEEVDAAAVARHLVRTANLSASPDVSEDPKALASGAKERTVLAQGRGTRGEGQKSNETVEHSEQAWFGRRATR